MTRHTAVGPMRLVPGWRRQLGGFVAASRWCWLLLGLGGGPGVWAGDRTEFGGMVLGPEDRARAVLRNLQGASGIRWIRSNAPWVGDYGFAGLGDVRLLIPPDGRPADRLPEDLFAVYRAVRAGVEAGGPSPEVWEVWNEPDFHFVSDTAADMAAMLKASWWGVKSARPGTRVLMPSMAFRPGRYAVELAYNGLASWTDAYNLHFYGWAADYAAVLAQHRVLTEAAGIQAPWWVTEIGYMQLPAAGATDVEALARQSAFHERVMVESRLAGIAAHLAFAFSAGGEGTWELGLSDPAGQPRPALRAMVRLAALLQEAEPARRLVHRETGECLGAALRGRDGEWWMVLWSGARPREAAFPGVESGPGFPERWAVRLHWDAATTAVRVGLNGETTSIPGLLRDLELVPEQVLHFRGTGRLPTVEDCRWVELNSGSLPRPRVSRVWRRELAALPSRGEPSPVVMRWRPGGGSRADKPSQTWRVPGDRQFPVTLQLHNFSEGPVTGRWEIKGPAGWTVQAEDGTDIGSVGREVRIDGLSRQEVVLRVRAPRGAAFGEAARWTATWRGDDGRCDVASVRWEREAEAPSRVERVGWRDLVPRPSHPEAWQVFEPEPGRLHVEIAEAYGAQKDAVIRWAPPRGLRSTDRFHAELRVVQARERVHAQLFLVTDGGEVWRHDEWREVGGETPLRVEARVSEFAPTIWSRQRTFGSPAAGRVRWMVMRFQGVNAGDIVEIRDPAWHRH